VTATTLYRLRDEHGKLLYVGIAGNPGRRFEQHADTKAWWPEVARVDLEHFDTRDEALIAETIAIVNEEPAYNIRHGNPEACTVKVAPLDDAKPVTGLIRKAQRAYAEALEAAGTQHRRLVTDSIAFVDWYDHCDECEKAHGHEGYVARQRYPWAIVTRANGQRMRIFHCERCGNEWRVWHQIGEWF
jgi:excinuclease UvrABC nuclease subunit